MRNQSLYIVFSIVSVFIVTASLGAQPQFIEESFEAPAGWTWGLPTEVQTSGGTPGAYLLTTFTLDSAIPKLRTGDGVASPFVGDYRAGGVRGVSVTLQIDAVPTPFGRDLSVELTNDGGTPFDVQDDCSAYLVGDENIPLPGDGWKTFAFRIPSGVDSLPSGWRLLSAAGGSCPGLTSDEAWNLVITDVSKLQFSYGDPSLFYIFQQWEGMALDNPTLAVTE